jgi:hypothetical protein
VDRIADFASDRFTLEVIEDSLAASVGDVQLLTFDFGGEE